MKLYTLISKTWNILVIVLLQRARNRQTIIEALVYNRSRMGSTLTTARPVPVTIPVPCRRNLIQTILQQRIKRTPTVTPTGNTPCDHDRCNLYAAAHMKNGTIKRVYEISSTTRHNIQNTLSEHINHAQAYVYRCPNGHSSRIDNLLLSQQPLY